MFYTTYMHKKVLLLIVLSLLLFVSLKYLNPGCDCNVTERVTIGDTEIQAFVSDTDDERAQGLSGKEGLGEDEGMLFVFEYPAKHGFWMKDMNFAIDIIWINAEKQVLGIERGVEPATFPQVFYPPDKVLYVLEVPKGFSDTAKIVVGQTLSIGQ